MDKREMPQSARELASIQKIFDDIEKFRSLKLIFPLIRPFLQSAGVKVDEIEKQFEEMEKIQKNLEELTNTLDRFNELFSGRGWISYESMNFEVTKAAVLNAVVGEWGAAEAGLVEYFDADEVRRGIRRMHSVRAFRPRLRLARLAAEDYAAGRYHACIPVVLALLDGMVNEIHQKVHGSRRGISSEGVDLNAWDSIAAHNNGLNQLVKIFQTGRRKTSEEEIDLPYRNGIMHGIDLGYDNKTVAAKCWAALFATREWAVKAEQGQHEAPTPTPEPTLEETWNSLASSIRAYGEMQEASKRLEGWKPRQWQIGSEIPRNGPPSEYRDGSPEQKLVEYLSNWSKRNFGYMARCIADVFGPPKAKAAAQVRQEFSDKRLLSFELMDLCEETYAITEITVALKIEWNGSNFEVQHRYRMVHQGDDGMPVLPDLGPAEWKVINWGFPDAAIVLQYGL
ncbi:MAG TPA: hypothetical protein VFJ16_14550 [Longimicrobium sp.]|nr:hypothetical protein [Longimicrobium sp.]